MKTVLITGARSGLGLALAREFLGKGWRVVAAGQKMAELPDDVRTNPNTTTIELELSDETTVRACATTLVGVPIDVLINNAGVYDSSSVDDDAIVSTLDAIAHVFVINAIAPRLLADLLLPNLALGSERLVVGISSGMGTFAQLAGRDLEPTSRGTNGYEALHWVYSASKTALNYALLAFGVSHPDIKVSLINPGWMQTAIGGKDAPESTEESAAHIALLILAHKTRLPASTLVDHLGDTMEL
ncbi:MAG TPA: SDR family NAD(P)-dependent oxidoreductase [Candidatus Paceibacterota bacterium]|nr:SDR family NAD(P)-dependent oxidoreductase [Candidatus Paceibacterota bacterium]